jgi:DNA-binding MarR family transcriptional regulator
MAPLQKPKTKTDIALEFGRSMIELRIYLRQFIKEKLKEHNVNLTFEMLEVMGCLWNADGVSQQQLADITLREKSNMTMLLDNLAKRKLITRVENPDNRRVRLIYLTAEGKALQKQLQPWLAEVYNRATADVDTVSILAGQFVVNKMLTALKNT